MLEEALARGLQDEHEYGDPFERALDQDLKMPTSLQLFEEQGWNEGGNALCVLEETIPGLDLGSELPHLLADNWVRGCFVLEGLEAEGVTSLEVGHWLATPELGRVGVRRIHAQVPVAMLPGAAPKVRFVYRVLAEDSEGSPIQSITVDRAMKAEVPFGDCFSVQERIIMRASPGGATVTKFFQVVWEKSTWMQRIILANTESEQRKTASLLLQALRGHTQPVQKPLLSKPTRCVQVWEVRRRAEGCLVPCLPRCQTPACWLDEEFKRCPVDPAAKLNSCGSQRPPVCLPGGWKLARDGWSVVSVPGASGGWQYSYGFSRSDSFWGTKSAGRRWQRRLWRCTLEEASVEKSESEAQERQAKEGSFVRKSIVSCLTEPSVIFVLLCTFVAALHPAGTSSCQAIASSGKANLPFFAGLR